MKNTPSLKSLLRVALVLLSVAGSGLADAPARMIEVGVEFVRATEVQMNDALKAAAAGKLPVRSLTADQFGSVRKTLKDGKLEFFGNLNAVTSSGSRAMVNAVREVRYPTEYEPSEKFPGKMFPTAFEVRNAGVEFEFEATAGPGVIDLTLAPTVTDFLGFIDYGSGKPARISDEKQALEDLLKAPLTEGGVWQPIFSTFRLKTTVNVESGSTLLFEGAMEPAVKKTEQRVFIFVTAKIVSQG